MMTALMIYLSLGGLLLALVAIVSDIRRHWPDIVRVSQGRDADPINWIEVRFVDGETVAILPDDEDARGEA